MQIETLYQHFLKSEGVETDSRKVRPGVIYFALKGDRFNGNHFAVQALEKGASFVVVDEDIPLTDNRVFRASDALTTLQQLARHHRLRFNIPFIAITGSNGKTTTKELVHAVLSSSFTTYTTKGNLNNHIGIPLTLLAIKPDAQMAVVEMGANHQKEIESYCSYVLPTHGLITNCGKAHLEGFGGEEGVRKGKGELMDFLRQTQGVAFAYDDYDYMHQLTNGIQRVIWFGTRNGLLTGHSSSYNGMLQVVVGSGLNVKLINTKLVGDYNLSNVLAAAAIGKFFGVKDLDIQLSLEQYTPSNSRSQLMEWKGNKIVLDAYNANPSSMRVAIENFKNFKSEKKVLILGAMMELGEFSVEEHQNIVSLIASHTWSDVVLVGDDFKHTHHQFSYFDTVDQAAQWLQQQGFNGASILIKGSRSMQMEKVLQ